MGSTDALTFSAELEKDTSMPNQCCCEELPDPPPDCLACQYNSENRTPGSLVVEFIASTPDNDACDCEELLGTYIVPYDKCTAGPTAVYKLVVATGATCGPGIGNIVSFIIDGEIRNTSPAATYPSKSTYVSIGIRYTGSVFNTTDFGSVDSVTETCDEIVNVDITLNRIVSGSFDRQCQFFARVSAGA